VAKTKVRPAVRFTDMKANAGMRFSVAGAKMSERMTYIRANLMLKLYRLQHPSHPVKRVAATETIKELKAAATGNSHACIAMLELEPPGFFVALSRSLSVFIFLLEVGEEQIILVPFSS
jgi:hypothetical protein